MICWHFELLDVEAVFWWSSYSPHDVGAFVFLVTSSGLFWHLFDIISLVRCKVFCIMFLIMFLTMFLIFNVILKIHTLETRNSSDVLSRNIIKKGVWFFCDHLSSSYLAECLSYFHTIMASNSPAVLRSKSNNKANNTPLTKDFLSNELCTLRSYFEQHLNNLKEEILTSFKKKTNFLESK